jgi:two-component system, OmpR family, sensor histidine kinase QseC
VKIRRSLMLRLIVGQLIVLIVFCLLATGNLFWEFHKKDEGEFDHQLAASAKTLLAVLDEHKQDHAAIRRDISFLAQAGFIYEHEIKRNTDNMDTSIIRLADKSGNEIYRSSAFAASLLASLPIGRSDFKASGKNWRAFAMQNADRSLTLQVAQTSNTVNNELVDIVTKYIFLPLLWFLPFAALVIWLVTARGLAPLRELTNMISRRNPTDMTPLKYVTSYAETEPLVKEINSLLFKLDTTLTRERNFLADAAHELRTPLAVIQAQVHVLKNAASEREKSVASDELNIGVERAASLIKKLLLTARYSVEDFTPHFEPTDLTAFIQERIATFSVLAAGKEIEMSLTAPPRCFAIIDRETFGSAIDNVLDNAIRYTPRAGTIMVDIETSEDDKVRLRVADNGAGIPSELYERVFERFYRVAGTEQSGSGLGLAIVRKVLALHGGDVALSAGLDQRGLAVALIMPVGVRT